MNISFDETDLKKFCKSVVKANPRVHPGKGWVGSHKWPGREGTLPYIGIGAEYSLSRALKSAEKSWFSAGDTG
jgi:hypothetical protein